MSRGKREHPLASCQSNGGVLGLLSINPPMLQRPIFHRPQVIGGTSSGWSSSLEYQCKGAGDELGWRTHLAQIILLISGECFLEHCFLS